MSDTTSLKTVSFTIDSRERKLGIPGIYEITPGTNYKNMKGIKLDYFSGSNADDFLDEGEPALPTTGNIIPTTGPFIIPDTDVFDVYIDQVDTPSPKNEATPFDCTKFKNSRNNNFGTVPVVKPPVDAVDQTEPLFTYSGTKQLLGSFSMGGTFQPQLLLTTLSNKINNIIEPVTYGNQFCILEYATDYNGMPYSVIARLFASESGIPSGAPPGTLYIGCVYLRPRVYNTTANDDLESFPSVFHYLGCERGLFRIGGDQQYMLYRSLDFGLYNTFTLSSSVRLRLYMRVASTGTFINTGSQVVVQAGVLTLEAVADRIYSLMVATPFVSGPFYYEIKNNAIYFYATNTKTTTTYNAIKIIQTGNNQTQLGGFIAEWLGFDLSCGIYFIFSDTDPPSTVYRVKLRPGFIYDGSNPLSPYTDKLDTQVYGPGQYEDSVTLAYQFFKTDYNWLYKDIQMIKRQMFEYMSKTYYEENDDIVKEKKKMISYLIDSSFDVKELRLLSSYEKRIFNDILQRNAEYDLVANTISTINKDRNLFNLSLFYRTKENTYSTVFGRILLNIYARKKKHISLYLKSNQLFSAYPHYVKGYTLIPRDQDAIFMRIRNFPMSQTSNTFEAFTFLLHNYSFYESGKAKCFVYKENTDYLNANVFKSFDYQIKDFVIEFTDIHGNVIGNMGEHTFRLTIQYDELK